MNDPDIDIPDDLSSLEHFATDDADIAVEVSKLNALNFIIDAFTTPHIRQHMDDDSHICMYIRHLFPKGITHPQLHERLTLYMQTYNQLKHKYSAYGVQVEGPLFDQMLSEYRHVLLPILEG